MSLDRLRKAIRANRISFPSQVPVFRHQPNADIQWRLVELFFIHNLPCTALGPRYGISADYARELIARWVRRAAALDYIQEIPLLSNEAPAEPQRGKPSKTPERVIADLTQSTGLCRYSFGRVTVDLEAHSICVGRRKVDLTPNEWAILWRLLSHANRTVPRTELEKVLVGAPLDARGAVRHFIENLRRKLERDSTRPRYLITKRAIGYCLQIPKLASAYRESSRA